MKKHLSILIGISAFALVATTLIAAPKLSLVSKTNADVTSFTFEAKDFVSSSEASGGEFVRNTPNGNPITFLGTGLLGGHEDSNNDLLRLNSTVGSYFENDTAISGINKITIKQENAPGASFKLKYGNVKNLKSEEMTWSNPTAQGLNNDDVIFTLTSPANYFRIEQTSNVELHIKSFVVEYSCLTQGLPEKLTILYQGDSITDASRDWNDPLDLGNGYARIVSENLSDIYDGRVNFTFRNNAHSGWNIIDNWNEGGVNHYQEQFYQFNADIATILIGYNDIQDAYGKGKREAPNYVSDEAYEAAYDELLGGLKARGTYAICLGPYFIYDYSDVDYCQTEFANKRAIVKKLAEKYDFTYLDMKPSMDAATKAGAREMELFGDLTHPSAAGNHIIADLVMNEIRDVFDSSYERNPNAGKYVPITGSNDNPNDLTNNSVFCYSSLGDVSYDSTTYSDRDDMHSSESLKLTCRGNYNIGSYTMASITFPMGVDLRTLKINFDIKVDNALRWVSVLAHSSIWTKSRNISKSTEFDFSNSHRIQSLGNGWYHGSLNVSEWMQEDESNAAILQETRQIVFTMSRGESASSRAANGIDSTKVSTVWIDNFTLTQGDEHDEVIRGKWFETAIDTIFQFDPIDPATGTITLDYRFEDDGTSKPCIVLALFQDWDASFAWFTVYKDGSVSDPICMKTIPLSDGYMRLVITTNKIPSSKINNNKEPGVAPKYINILEIRKEWTLGSGYVDLNPLPGIATELRGRYYEPTLPAGIVFDFDKIDVATGTIILDFYFLDGKSKYISIGLYHDWSRSFAWFTVHGDGTVNSQPGVSCRQLDDGYLRITFTLKDLVLTMTERPTYINHLQVRQEWADTRGYADLISPAL